MSLPAGSLILKRSYQIPHNMTIPKLLLLLATTFFFLHAYSQSQTAREEKLKEIYDAHTRTSASLYSGAAYIEQNYPRNGSPFFNSDTMVIGWVSYDGHRYDAVPLQWSTYQNFLLTLSLNKMSKIILRNDLIDSFYFSDCLVKYIPAEKDANLVNAGLYQVIYDGPSRVLARRMKESSGVIEDNKRVVYYFRDKSRFYIRKDGINYRVNNKQDIKKLFRSNFPAIRREGRRQGLRWRDNFDEYLFITAKIFDKANPVK